MVPHLLYPSSFGYQRRRKRRTEHAMAAQRRMVSSIVKGKKRRWRRHVHADWSSVNSDVLERVQKKLPFADTLNCRSICSRWRSVTLNHIISSLNTPPPPQLPPLVIWRSPTLFFDAFRPKKYLFNLIKCKSRRSIPGQLARCVGFSHGWYLFGDRIKNDSLCLFHPLWFSATGVRFPPIVTPEGCHPILTPDPDLWRAVRAILWADPILSNGNYGVTLIHPYYKNLIFVKSGATQFTDIEQQVGYTKWKDIICFKNRIYGVALTSDGEHHMEAWDCTCPGAGPIKVLDFQPEFSSGNRPSSRSTIHLVESQDELLLVSIQRPDRRAMTRILRKTMSMSFPKLFVLARCPDTVRVYKMDFVQRKWVQMESLGDRVLFIMKHQNLSVSTHEFPQYKRNTVYFSHEIERLSTCIGVFNMEDGSMNEIWPYWPPWLTPYGSKENRLQ